jgi:hypothetical protein
MASMIPAFLCIDVEPDESAPDVAPRPWSGFASIVDFIERLREPLAERSGVAPHPTWFFRMDPVIETCFGSTDFAVQRHRGEVERILTSGDPLAIHVHPQRWDEGSGVVFSDHSDASWATRCVQVAAETFERAFGEPLRRASMGGRFIPEHVVDALVEVGVQVDLSAEPGVAPIADDRSYGHGATAPSTDFRGYPRYPYRVSKRGLGVPATSTDDARALVEIPRSTTDVEWALGSVRRRVGMTVRRTRTTRSLNPWEDWPSPTTYWDLVERSADESPLPFVALTFRSDPLSRPSNQTVRTLLAALPGHPIAKRLAFVDPLTFADLPAGSPKADGALQRHWLGAARAELETHRV